MTQLADACRAAASADRARLDLLVEAAAGTGKTALMAGRLTMLLARGAEPRIDRRHHLHRAGRERASARASIAMSTSCSPDGCPSRCSWPCPTGLTDAQQRSALSAAAAKLDELTTTTIHAFCQTIICSYAVEADIDPGARILDAVQAEAAFDAVFEQWFEAAAECAGAARTIRSPPCRRTIPIIWSATLQALARFRLEHRDARTPPADLAAGPISTWSMRSRISAAGLRRSRPSPRRSSLSASLRPWQTTIAGSFDRAARFLRALAVRPSAAASACMRRRTFDLLTPTDERRPGRGSPARIAAERSTTRPSPCSRAWITATA